MSKRKRSVNGSPARRAVSAEQGDVGYVVPTLGTRPQWLHACLKSILAQPEISIVVVVRPPGIDLGEFASEPRIVELNDPKAGLSAAINEGMERVLDHYRVGFVGWLGDDDVLAPASVALSLRSLKGSPSAPFCFGRLRYIDESGSPLWLLRPGLWSVAYAHWGRNFIGQPGSLIRREAWTHAGGLDVHLKSAMDQDLFLGLARMGHPHYIPAELAAFRLHAESITVSKTTHSESEMIAARYRGNAWYVRWLCVPIARAILDRILLFVHKRIPGPRAPTIGGTTYTKL